MLGDAALLDELAANAWPAATVQNLGAWRLRYTPGVDRRRSNSVLPPTPDAAGALPVTAALETAYEFYARRGLPLRIQVTPLGQQRRLDERLAAAGLRSEAPTLVLAATVPAVRASCGEVAGLQVGERDAEWMQAWRAVEGRPDTEAVGHLVLARIGPRTAYAAVRDRDSLVAVGMAVVERGWAGLFCMGTLTSYRRRGHGRGARCAGGLGFGVRRRVPLPAGRGGERGCSGALHDRRLHQVTRVPLPIGTRRRPGLGSAPSGRS